MKRLGMFTLGCLLAFGMTACSGGTTPDKNGSETGTPSAESKPTNSTDKDNILVLELKTGKVQIKLRPDLAPQHVERIKLLAREGFYNGIKFHRVIPNFMAQTGDPKGDGTGGSKYPNLKAEFTPTSFERGTVGAARSNDPNSANSQFFICFTHTPFLNGKYTVWGEVIDGMQNIDQVAKGEPPPVPDIIVKAYLLSEQK